MPLAQPSAAGKDPHPRGAPAARPRAAPEAFRRSQDRFEACLRSLVRPSPTRERRLAPSPAPARPLALALALTLARARGLVLSDDAGEADNRRRSRSSREPYASSMLPYETTARRSRSPCPNSSRCASAFEKDVRRVGGMRLALGLPSQVSATTTAAKPKIALPPGAFPGALGRGRTRRCGIAAHHGGARSGRW
jgi:hypothetical protein